MAPRLTALVAVPLVLLVLAGCASSTPKHTQTAAEKCTPKTATVQWGPSNVSDQVTTPALVTIYKKSSDGITQYRSRSVAPPMRVDFTEDDLARASATSEKDWDAALVRSVRLTGQVPTNFGIQYKLEPLATGANSGTGSFIENDEEAYVTVPFTIECAGVRHVSGDVRGPISGAIMTVFVECTQKAAKNDGQQVTDGLALAAKYCGAV
jgi:hypothetical protein